MKKKIPEFKNEAEERLFWQSHDTADYLDWADAENRAQKIASLLNENIIDNI